jgi:uncharacterized membrane protein
MSSTELARGWMKAHERRWPASLAVVVIIGLQFAAPDQIRPGWWPVLVTVEVLLLVPLVITNPLSLNRDHPLLRAFAVGLSGLLLVVNATRLVQLFVAMVNKQELSAAALIGSGALIWSTNVVATAVVFWELDRGGPFARDPRHHRREQKADLLYPQMTGIPGVEPKSWRPSFVDYLFVAFTTATAFSPTDTMPLTGRLKILMMVASSVSLLTIAIVAARAVNIL